MLLGPVQGVSVVPALVLAVRRPVLRWKPAPEQQAARLGVAVGSPAAQPPRLSRRGRLVRAPQALLVRAVEAVRAAPRRVVERSGEEFS